MEAMIKELSGIAIHKNITTQNGEPDAITVANMLAKKSDALGLRMFAKKPIFAVWKGEKSLCAPEHGAPFCVSALIRKVLIPRYAR